MFIVVLFQLIVIVSLHCLFYTSYTVGYFHQSDSTNPGTLTHKKFDVCNHNSVSLFYMRCQQLFPSNNNNIITSENMTLGMRYVFPAKPYMI